MEIFKGLILGYLGGPLLLIGFGYAYAFPGTAALIIGGFLLFVFLGVAFMLAPAREANKAARERQDAQKRAEQQCRFNEDVLHASDPNWHPQNSLDCRAGPVVIRRRAVKQPPRYVPKWEDDPLIPSEYRR